MGGEVFLGGEGVCSQGDLARVFAACISANAPSTAEGKIELVTKVS